MSGLVLDLPTILPLLIKGPPFASAFDINKVSGLTLLLFDAFEPADFNVFKMSFAALVLLNFKILSASKYFSPLTKSKTTATFLGEIFKYLDSDVTRSFSIFFTHYSFFAPDGPAPAAAIFFDECALNVLVGENSPSLCPTIDSTIKTGI